MKEWFYYIVRALLQIIFRLGFGLEVTGVEHVPTTGGFLVASNHASYLDPPVIGAACPRPVSFLARRTLFDHVLLAMFMRGVHVIPLEREEWDLSAMREATRRLRNGEGVGLFPEGIRQETRTLGVAKRGVGLLAKQGRVPVIPVVIRGTLEAWSVHGRLRRVKIRVAFGAPIPYTVIPAQRSEYGSAQPVSSRARHEALAEAVTRQWHQLAHDLDRAVPSSRR